MSVVGKRFTAFGLIIESDFDLPELIPYSGDAATDVAIRRAALKRAQITAAESFTLSDVLQQLDWKAVGRFDIRGIAEILVEPNPETPEAVVRLPLLGSVMALLLSLRGEVVLHASAVRVRDMGIAFLGDKRAGKSTTAGLMVSRGCQLISDDVLALSHSGSRLLPGYPQMKFAGDSAGLIELNDARRLPFVDFTGFDKFQYQLGSHFSDRVTPPRRFYVLERGQTSAIETVDIPTAFQSLMRFSYMNRFGAAALTTGVLPDMMQVFSDVASRGLVKRLRIPDDLSRLDETAQLIENDIAGF